MSSARLTQNGLGAALAGDTNLTPARQPALRQRRRQGHAPERQVARPRLRGRRDLPRDVCCPAQRPGALGARPPRLPRAARRVRHQHGRQLKAERGRARGPHPHSSGACTFSGPYRAPPATRAARPRSRTTVASHSVPVRRLAGAGARHRHRRGIRAPREFPRREAQRAVWVHLRLSSSAPPSSPTQLGISTSSWRASSSGRRTPAWRPPTRWLSSLATSPTVTLVAGGSSMQIGFHQCRWGYHNLSVVEDVVENYWSAQIPLDMIWNDDDHMDARKDLTLSPVNYSRPKLLAFLDMLLFHWLVSTRVLSWTCASSFPRSSMEPPWSGCSYFMMCLW